jgi:hypothetical protein
MAGPAPVLGAIGIGRDCIFSAVPASVIRPDCGGGQRQSDGLTGRYATNETSTEELHARRMRGTPLVPHGHLVVGIDLIGLSGTRNPIEIRARKGCKGRRRAV